MAVWPRRPPARAVCPWCRRPIALKVNGKLWNHRRFSAMAIAVNQCEGALKTPAAAAADLAATREAVRS